MNETLEARLDGLRSLGIQIVQNTDELAGVFAWAEANQRIGTFGRFVEVGSLSGASLYVYAALCCSRAQIISVDIERSVEHRANLTRVIAELTVEGLGVTLLGMNSMAGNTIQKVQGLTGGRGVDLLHIDGDHRYVYVLHDYAVYGAMMEDHGVVLLHDVADTDGPLSVFDMESHCHAKKKWTLEPGRGIGLIEVQRP